MDRRSYLSDVLGVWRGIDEQVQVAAAQGQAIDTAGFCAWAVAQLPLAWRLGVLQMALNDLAAPAFQARPTENDYMRQRRERALLKWAFWQPMAAGFLQGLEALGRGPLRSALPDGLAGGLARGQALAPADQPADDTPDDTDLAAAALLDLLWVCAVYAQELGPTITPREIDALQRCLQQPWLRARAEGRLKQVAARLHGAQQPVLSALLQVIDALLADGAPSAADLARLEAPDWPAPQPQLAALNQGLDAFVQAFARQPQARASQLPEVRPLLALGPEDRLSLLLLSLVQDRADAPLSISHPPADPYGMMARQKLRSELLRKPLPLSPQQAQPLLAQMAQTEARGGQALYESALRWVMAQARAGGFEAAVRGGLSTLAEQLRSGDQTYAPVRKLLAEMDAYLASWGKVPDAAINLDPDSWGVPAQQALQRLGLAADPTLQRWLQHCQDTGSGVVPSARWQRALKDLLAASPLDLKPVAVQLLAALQHPQLADAQAHLAGQALLVGARNAELLKGLAWSCLAWADDGLAAALREAALAAFRKVPEWGARSVKAGNACVAVLAQWPGLAGAQALCSLQTSVKQPSARATVGKALAHCAERLGLGLDALQELAVDGHGLADGQRRFVLGRHSALLRVDAAGVHLSWHDGDAALKTEPASIRREYSAERAALRQAHKDIERGLAAARQRLEGLLASERRWSWPDFQQHYLNHPLVACLARPLVWTLAIAGQPRAALMGPAGWCDAQGQPLLAVKDGATDGATDGAPEQAIDHVAPWHPAAVPAQEVLAWRQRLVQLGLRQPFKQVYREVYRLTDAERQTATYSNRFAGHVLRQHAMARICTARGWQYRLQSGFDAGSPHPTLKLPHHALSAEFWVHQAEGPADEQSAAGISLHVLSDQLRFYAEPATPGRREPLPLDQVPPLALSEVMRDVDLLVAVSSLGADPLWTDAGPEGRFGRYWRDYAFGALGVPGHTRRELLADLLPALGALRGIAQLDERHLVVQGRLRRYRIHLGSGHIQMSPNDQYLCIVPDGRARQPGLAPPLLDGDATLSIIVSKALLLAKDDEIRDPSIVSQIRG